MILIIIVLVIITVIYINNIHINESQVEDKLTKTIEIEDETAKYTLLKNEDDTIYGIKFENLNLMTQINIIKTGSREDIISLIKNNTYEFTTDGIYKLEIVTTNGAKITSTTFKVVAQK